MFIILFYNSISHLFFPKHYWQNIAASSAQFNKQMPSTIDENCATGSGSYTTGNGDISSQPSSHAPPLQVK